MQADALSPYISEEAGVDGEKARRGLSHARMQTIGRIPVDAAEAMSSVGAARSLRNLGKWSWRRYVPALGSPLFGAENKLDRHQKQDWRHDVTLR